MATSGSSDFNLNATEIVEEAFERCGLELRTGYDNRTARRSLNLMFADWANKGVNLLEKLKIHSTSCSAFKHVCYYDVPCWKNRSNSWQFC